MGSFVKDWYWCGGAEVAGGGNLVSVREHACLLSLLIVLREGREGVSGVEISECDKENEQQSE